MKKRLFIPMRFAMLCLVLAACEKAPEVFSVNNFSMVQDSVRTRMGVTALTLPDITGHWTGLEHNIDVNITNGMNGINFYSVRLIDTAHSRDSSSTWFDVDFMAAAGKPYAEVISWGCDRDPHEFSLVLSTYLKINKLTSDTIIVQMLNSAYTEKWLKARRYNYFVTEEEKKQKEHFIYLTEDLPQLTAILKELYRVPQVFQSPDTIVRRVLTTPD